MVCSGQHARFSRDYQFGFYGCGWRRRLQPLFNDHYIMFLNGLQGMELAVS